MFQKEHIVTFQTIDEQSLIEAFQALKNEISELKSILIAQTSIERSEDTTLMTRAEVSKFFQVNMSTVRNWSISGILQPYYMGDRVYFKRSEVMNALIPAQLSTK